MTAVAADAVTGAPELTNKINLTLLNGTGYVFSVDDYMTLRQTHRIIGALVGTCSTRGWSASDCTLPVELTPHETRLLVERGIAQLVSKQQSLLRAPTTEELEAYQQRVEAQYEAQAKKAKVEKLRETTRNMSKILEGKRRKLLKAQVPAEDIKLEPAQILQEVAENFKFEREQAQVEISCAHPVPHSFVVVDPPQIDNPLKYRVFCDFWTRGYYVTAGDTFGADFLLYPGDPLLYHASHIVILLDTPVVQPLELIAKVRLSVIVNKLCIFAYYADAPSADAPSADDAPDPDVAISGSRPETAREVHYQTVQWEGNRDKECLASTSAAAEC